MANERTLLHRALDAEDRCEELQKRVESLRRRLAGAMDMDPTTAVAALSWVTRAEQSEELLARLLRYIDQRAIETRTFPPGWVAQAQAQMQAVALTKRDAPEIERPETEDYWATEVGSDGNRQMIRERRKRRGPAG